MKKQSYILIVTKRQEGSLAATSSVSDEIWKEDALRAARWALNEPEVTEITIKKVKDAILTDTEI